jgi:hypothetical protein
MLHNPVLPRRGLEHARIFEEKCRRCNASYSTGKR